MSRSTNSSGPVTGPNSFTTPYREPTGRVYLLNRPEPHYLPVKNLRASEVDPHDNSPEGGVADLLEPGVLEDLAGANM
jgi:hypothetical protein